MNPDEEGIGGRGMDGKRIGGKKMMGKRIAGNGIGDAGRAARVIPLPEIHLPF